MNATGLETNRRHRMSTTAIALFAIVGTVGAIFVPSLSCSTEKKKTASSLNVTSYPPNETSTGTTEVQLRFDQPVVDEDQIGDKVEKPPIEVEPAVSAKAYWLDRQTMVVTIYDKLTPSTRYEVSLTGELGERTGRFSFDFVHQPLVVEGMWGVDLENLPIDPILPIHFNQAVRVEDVVAHCRLHKQGASDGDIALAPATEANVSDHVRVKPTSTLTRDTNYELTCDSLKGDGGDTPMAAAYVQKIHTHPAFAIIKATPTGADVAADDVDIKFEFATPVTLDDIRAKLSSKPKIAGLTQGWLDRAGKKYKARVNLKSLTRYKITFASDLADRFQQTLEKPYTLSFKTGTARPRMSFETGIYALEASAPGYPVWTRNVKDIDVQCAAVPKKRIVKLLTSALDYDPWYDAGNDKSLKWKKLGLRTVDQRISKDERKDKWQLTNLVMKDVCGSKTDHGLFLAEIRSPDVKPDNEHPWRYRPNRRVLANVTDLGILVKAGTASGLVWVTNLSTGKPVPGANVSVYTPQGRMAYRGQTDTDGLLRMPGSTQMMRKPGADDRKDFDDEYDDYYSYRSQRFIVIVEKGADLGVVDGNWANGIQAWNFGVQTDRRSGKSRIRGFIQSDRGIYRPGETVHFKGIVREITVNQPPVVPKTAKVKVNIEDSRGQNVFTKTMRLSQFGGFAFDLPLTTEANLGDYYVTAKVKGQTFRERFSVEEFRKVSYEIGLSGTERHGRLGAKLRFKVDANYLFGAPVTGATIEWNVQRRAHSIRFPKFPGYTFSDQGSRGYYYYHYDDYDGNSYTDYVSDGEGETDKRGLFRFSMRDPQTNFSGPQDYIVGVSVTDETEQTVTKSTVVTAHKTEFYLGLHTQEYVQAVDMPFSINTVALAPSGAHVGTKATMKFIRYTYECKWSGGYRSYRTCKQKQDVEMEREIDIPSTGTGTERIMPKKPGEYIIRIETKDDRGNKVVSSGYVWIIGKGKAFWSGDESARMSLIASKENYKAGETARLVPRTGMKNATALITVERNGILDAYIKPMASSADGIEIPLTELHAPNVFTSVAMVTGRTGEGDRNRPRFKLGITELKVSPENQQLDVAVTMDKPSYQPGETVSGVIRVTSAGQPVSAEVSVSVADEGVLQLIGYKTPDPMKTFYANWGLGIDSSTNWNRIARLNDPSTGDPDHGGDSGPGGGDKVRSNFVSSAFWAPALVTDENGEARFSFKAPDNLTAFRTMAVAADIGSKFGSGEKRFTIKKPLLAKPVLPRFLNTGDRARVGVIVHNYTGEDGEATVTATVKGVYLKKNTRTVKLSKDGKKRVDFPVKVLASRKATFEFSVAMASHSDALRLDVPINRPLTVEHKILAEGIGGANGEEVITIPVSWDDSLVANRSRITINVDRTGLASLEPSLRYLIEYPYGCLEQTLSRLIPLTKVKDLAASLNMQSLKGAKLDGFIKAGVAKIARHQHADGHFSLWPSGTVYPHLTVYALYGLTEAKRAGVKVPKHTIHRGIVALKQWTARQTPTPGGDSGTMAQAAYVLAALGTPDAGLVARLFETRRGLPRYGLAFLLRAMKRTKAAAKDIETVKNELIAAASVEGQLAIVRESDPKLSRYMSTDARSSAITLSALLEIDPDDDIIDRLVEGLKKLRKPSGYWRNTQANLYALVALSDYARGQAVDSELVAISMNGKHELRRRLKGAKVLSFRRYLNNYKPGELKLDVSGKVRYSVRLTEAREDPADTPVDQGFSVKSQYLNPKDNSPATEFKTGQLVKVRVEVEAPESREFVAVEAPLPAGFEAVNTKLATSANVSGVSTRSSWRWTHRELRDDRALGFADNMYKGTMTMEFLARATTPGTFIAPPARAEEMYSPEVYGRSTSTKIVIKKK